MVTSNSLIRTYTVLIHEAEEGGYWGEVLELPGCVSQGENLEEFRHNIKEAIEAVLEAQSEVVDTELQLEPALADKEGLQFSVSERYNSLPSAGDSTETWTATL